MSLSIEGAIQLAKLLSDANVQVGFQRASEALTQLSKNAQQVEKRTAISFFNVVAEKDIDAVIDTAIEQLTDVGVPAKEASGIRAGIRHSQTFQTLIRIVGQNGSLLCAMIKVVSHKWERNGENLLPSIVFVLLIAEPLTHLWTPQGKITLPSLWVDLWRIRVWASLEPSIRCCCRARSSCVMPRSWQPITPLLSRARQFAPMFQIIMLLLLS